MSDKEPKKATKQTPLFAERFRNSELNAANSPSRWVLAAWSRGAEWDPNVKEAGLIRIGGNRARVTTFTNYYPGLAEDIHGNQFHIEGSDVLAHWISDESVVINNKVETGSRFWMPSDEGKIYFFLGWNPDPKVSPNQSGFFVLSEKSFKTFQTEGGMWELTFSGRFGV